MKPIDKTALLVFLQMLSGRHVMLDDNRTMVPQNAVSNNDDGVDR
jgi:hypothetical protein